MLMLCCLRFSNFTVIINLMRMVNPVYVVAAVMPGCLIGSFVSPCGGHGDRVLCFCCDGILHNWERGDDPWVEHARWFPRCPYVLQQKGFRFVTDIQGRHAAMAEAQVKVTLLVGGRVAE